MDESGINLALTRLFGGAPRGARVVDAVPKNYGENMNPIERCWSKIKTFLRAARARTREALEAAIRQALATVTEADAHARFAHCGYALN